MRERSRGEREGERKRGVPTARGIIQSQHQATFKRNVLKSAYSLQDIGPRRRHSKTLGGLFGRKTNKDDDKDKSGGSSPKTAKSKKKQQSLDSSEMKKEEGREEEVTKDLGSLAQGLFNIRKASSTIDMSSRSRTKSFLGFFKPDKKQTKPSRISVQSRKKDSVSSSIEEQPQSFDEEAEANGVSSDKEASHGEEMVIKLPVVTIGSYEDNDGGEDDDEFVLRKAQSSFELGPHQRHPLLHSKLADKAQDSAADMADTMSLDESSKKDVEVDSTIHPELVIQKVEGEESASGGAESGHTPELVKKKTKKHKKDKAKKKKKKNKAQQDGEKEKDGVSDTETKIVETVEVKKIPAIEATGTEETDTPLAETKEEDTQVAGDPTATQERTPDSTATQTNEQEEKESGVCFPGTMEWNDLSKIL